MTLALATEMDTFAPDADHINALPGPLQRYLHDLETRVDPAGDVAEIAMLKEDNAALWTRVRELESQVSRGPSEAFCGVRPATTISPGSRPGLIILPQPNKAGMPQVAVRGHFQQLELAHQHRIQPPALQHLLDSQAHSPPPTLSFRQISKGALGRLQPPELPEQLRPPRCRCKAIAGAGHVDQPVTLVVANDHRIEVLGTKGVPGNHELLPLVDAHLPPGTRTLAGFIAAITVPEQYVRASVSDRLKT